jgi:site-specific DNA recombinase
LRKHPSEAQFRRHVRCAIYTRQSVRSSDELSSCQVQYDACRFFAESQSIDGWTLIPERFDDEGYSGASLERPALDRLLAKARQGQIDQIIVHRLDRLSRSMLGCVALLNELRQLRIDLAIVAAPELGHSAQDSFALNILASFAEFAQKEIAATEIGIGFNQARARFRFRSGSGLTFPRNFRTPPAHGFRGEQHG